MPLRTQPKIFLLQLKTHKLSIHVTALPTTTLAQLKQEALQALTSDVAEPLTRPPKEGPAVDGMEEDYDQFHINYDTGLPLSLDDVVPCVSNLQDFEICRAVKDKGKMTGVFEVIEANEHVQLKESGITGWEVLFVQFRDKENGQLQPVKYTLPPLDDDDDEGAPPPDAEQSNASLGKRKARGDD